MINFDQPELSSGNFYISIDPFRIEFLSNSCKKIVWRKKMKVFPLLAGPSETLEDIRRVRCPAELTEGQNKTIQVWDLK